MEILNGITMVRSEMTRHVDCDILADVSDESGAFVVLKAGWDPGQVWTFTKKKILSLFRNRTTKFSFIHLVPRLLTLIIN